MGQSSANRNQHTCNTHPCIHTDRHIHASLPTHRDPPPPTHTHQRGRWRADQCGPEWGAGGLALGQNRLRRRRRRRNSAVGRAGAEGCIYAGEGWRSLRGGAGSTPTPGSWLPYGKARSPAGMTPVGGGGTRPLSALRVQGDDVAEVA